MALLPRFFLQLIIPVLFLFSVVVLALCFDINDSDADVKRYCEVEDYIDDDQSYQRPSKLVAALLVRDVVSKQV